MVGGGRRGCRSSERPDDENAPRKRWRRASRAARSIRPAEVRIASASNPVLSSFAARDDAIAPMTLPRLAHAARPIAPVDARHARRAPAASKRPHLAAVHLRGHGCEEPIGSLPGVSRWSVDRLGGAGAARPPTLGIPCVALFPNTPDALRTETREEALNTDNLICRAIRAIKDAVPEVGVLTDVALDPYTAHGHDGLIDDRGQRHQRRYRQDPRRAGAGPGRRRRRHRRPVGHDGRPRRRDPRGARGGGHQNVAIMAYAAKYASAFYGPFREAVGSAGRLKGDKRGYQMDPANIEEALREVELDLAEGADFVMVKPGLPYLDVVARVKDAFGVPTFAYQVSRRICDDRGRRGCRCRRPRRADPRDPDRLQARRSDRRADLSRARRCAADPRLAQVRHFPLSPWGRGQGEGVRKARELTMVEPPHLNPLPAGKRKPPRADLEVRQGPPPHEWASFPAAARSRRWSRPGAGRALRLRPRRCGSRRGRPARARPGPGACRRPGHRCRRARSLWARAPRSPRTAPAAPRSSPRSAWARAPRRAAAPSPPGRGTPNPRFVPELTSSASRLASAALTGRSFIGRTTGTRGSIASAARGASDGGVHFCGAQPAARPREISGRTDSARMPRSSRIAPPGPRNRQGLRPASRPPCRAPAARGTRARSSAG